MTHLTFDGRASRKEFIFYKIFRFVLAILIMAAVFIPLLALIFALKGAVNIPSWSMFALVIFLMIAFVVCGGLGMWLLATDACVSIRRLHDFGYNAWFYLIFIVITYVSQAIFMDRPLIVSSLCAFFILFEFCIGAFVKGSENANEYGEKSSF